MTADSRAVTDGDNRGTAWRLIWTIARLGIGAALVYWLVRTGAIDWSALTLLLERWPLVVIGAALVLTAFTLMAARLVLLCRPTTIRVSLADAVRLTMVGTFFSLVLPGAAGGDVVRIWYATHGHAGRRAEVVAIFLFDRAIGMFTLVMMPLFVLPFAAGIRSVPAVQALAWTAGLMLAGMIGGLAVVMSERLRRSALVTWCFTHLPLGSSIAQMVDAVRVYRSAPGTVLQAIAISCVAQAVMIGATILLAGVLLGDAFNWSVLVLIPLGLLANAVPATPGGLGVGEAAFDSLFRLGGLSQGATVLIGLRLLLLVPAAIGLAIYLGGRKQFVTAADGTAHG